MQFCGTIAALLLTIASVSVVVQADWWENANFYQIYPRSFKDSDGDGTGDLRGIIDKLPYLVSLGVTATWLSPIFASPMKDSGYDISDFTAINPLFGTMTDFETLAARCTELGIKLILDFVPNHTSDEHEWFLQSAAGNATYADYYIWNAGTVLANGTRVPPSNWLSAFRYSAWEWNEQRQAYYLHQFVAGQPDLNYRNPAVVEAMKNVLRFWLAKGVSGFRIDAVPHLFEVEAVDGVYPDEPASGDCTDDPQSFCYLSHIYTQNQPETLDMLYQWRAVLDTFKTDNPGVDTKILMTEAYTSLSTLMLYYGNGTHNGSHIPFNFQLLINLQATTTGTAIQNLIASWLNGMPAGAHANWVLGNHDNHRLASRLGTARIDLFNIMLKTLPGIAVTYMGEELGMTDVHVSWADTQDPQACNTNETVYHANSRDPARTPFQWDATLYAGYSTTAPTGTPWLPVGPNYKTVNVASQELLQRSHLKVFRTLIATRAEPSMNIGSYEPVMVTDNVLAYRRYTSGSSPFIVILNFGTTATTLNLQSVFPTASLPTTMKIVTSSILSQYRDGFTVSITNIEIRGNHGVVFTV